jgi:hypothetical protein
MLPSGAHMSSKQASISGIKALLIFKMPITLSVKGKLAVYMPFALGSLVMSTKSDPMAEYSIPV